MRRSNTWTPAVAVALATLVIGGCGSSSLSTAALRSRATRVCEAANSRLDRIPVPRGPGGADAFLGRGVTWLQVELAALQRLRPDGAAADRYREAITVRARELSALQASFKSVRARNDPVITIKTLQHQLSRLEVKANSAWRALGIDACARG